MGVTAKDVIKVAENEVGYMEKKSNKNLDKKTANVGDNNYQKYSPVVIGMNGVYWCNAFTSWCFYKACGNSKTKAKEMQYGTFSASCNVTMNGFKNAKKFYSTPKIGDLIFFRGSRHAGATHIGIVYKVDNSKVYTIEGNTHAGNSVVDNGGEVCKKSYKLSHKDIIGYGRPKYDTTSTTNIKNTKTTITTKQSSTKQGIITVSIANVRTGAGTNYSLCKSNELKNGLKLNTKVDIIDQEKASNGKIWYLIKYKGKQGYVSSACMKQI